jgi:hypothetical protein
MRCELLLTNNNKSEFEQKLKGTYYNNMIQIVNAYYKEWLKTNDPYTADEDFMDILERLCPDIKFSLTNNNEIIIL